MQYYSVKSSHERRFIWVQFLVHGFKNAILGQHFTKCPLTLHSRPSSIQSFFESVQKAKRHQRSGHVSLYLPFISCSQKRGLPFNMPSWKTSPIVGWDWDILSPACGATSVLEILLRSKVSHPAGAFKLKLRPREAISCLFITAFPFFHFFAWFAGWPPWA